MWYFVINPVMRPEVPQELHLYTVKYFERSQLSQHGAEDSLILLIGQKDFCGYSKSGHLNEALEMWSDKIK